MANRVRRARCADGRAPRRRLALSVARPRRRRPGDAVRRAVRSRRRALAAPLGRGGGFRLGRSRSRGARSAGGSGAHRQAAACPCRRQPSGRAATAHLRVVSRAVEIACANSACIAAVMSPSVVTVKNMPVEAQLSRFGLIWLWYVATQLLYQELVVSGRYSV